MKERGGERERERERERELQYWTRNQHSVLFCVNRLNGESLTTWQNCKVNMKIS